MLIGKNLAVPYVLPNIFNAFIKFCKLFVIFDGKKEDLDGNISNTKTIYIR